MKVCRSKGLDFAYSLMAVCLAAICLAVFFERFCPNDHSSELAGSAFAAEDSKGGGDESGDEPTEYA